MSDCVCSAFTDALTDLPNMSYFRSIAKDNLLKWLEEGKSVCVIYFDIENIKIVNDRFGHKKGDELLVFTANTISKRFAGDIAARIADDHFAVMTLINGIEDKINVIQKAVAEFFEDFHIELKAGIYVFSEDDSSISKACDRAKIACDSIKRRYDVGFKFYDKAMIYLDFSGFEGREMMPREACLRDCVLFLGNEGNAETFDDYPIDDYYKINRYDDISILCNKIRDVLNNYDSHIQNFEFFKNKCLYEPMKWEWETTQLFGKLFKK